MRLSLRATTARCTQRAPKYFGTSPCTSQRTPPTEMLFEMSSSTSRGSSHRALQLPAAKSPSDEAISEEHEGLLSDISSLFEDIASRPNTKSDLLAALKECRKNVDKMKSMTVSNVLTSFRKLGKDAKLRQQGKNIRRNNQAIMRRTKK